MRHTEFWARLESAVGAGYYEVWADQYVMSELGGLTARQALEAGYTPKEVWAAVWRALDLPATLR
ncbi:DUF3046 domain-containing protein [Nocardioides sp. Kera G14]|uniref:DUF3046 domain-containing protein n=1 Tax=Nocardioides sp. Kera G14 TaxID=2884264 RepID=UPI001D10CDDE|nr:DUF3046 domain-containing protein [Nocardioides sp. Kera G14]UDY25075.1 DUF3046 domain-containing protein [Nocardioides sp. Kera G14]